MKKKKSDSKRIDNDNPQWTEKMFRDARPAIAVFTELWGKEKAEAFVYKGRGRPRKSDKKISTTLRMDANVLKAFRAQGKGWQSHINQVLKEWVAAHPVT